MYACNYVTYRCGRLQNMDPWSMEHPCGAGPWASSWTRFMENLCGPPQIYEEEFLPEV